MKGKKSFVAYTDWKEMFEELPDEDAGKLIKHIFRYVNDENPETDSLLVRALFAQIKTTLKRDLDKWDNLRRQRSEAGKASAASRKGKSTLVNEKKQKPTVVNENSRTSTVRVSVSDSVNVNVKESVNTRAFQFLENKSKLRLEQEFSIPFKKQIRDLPRFIDSFNDKVDFEEIPFEPKKLIARLRTFARNWIEIQKKEKPQATQTTTSSIRTV